MDQNLTVEPCVDNIYALLNVPIFWCNNRIAEFFAELNDTIKRRKGNPRPRIETYGPKVFEGEWCNALDSRIGNYLRGYINYKTKGPLYDPKSLASLIAAVRNTISHLHDSNRDQGSFYELFGVVKNDSVCYWMKVFPNLLPVAYLYVQTLLERGVKLPNMEKFLLKEKGALSDISGYLNAKTMFQNMFTNLQMEYANGTVLSRFKILQNPGEPNVYTRFEIFKLAPLQAANIGEHQCINIKTDNELLTVTKVSKDPQATSMMCNHPQSYPWPGGGERLQIIICRRLRDAVDVAAAAAEEFFKDLQNYDHIAIFTNDDLVDVSAALSEIRKKAPSYGLEVTELDFKWADLHQTCTTNLLNMKLGNFKSSEGFTLQRLLSIYSEDETKQDEFLTKHLHGDFLYRILHQQEAKLADLNFDSSSTTTNIARFFNNRGIVGFRLLKALGVLGVPKRVGSAGFSGDYALYISGITQVELDEKLKSIGGADNIKHSEDNTNKSNNNKKRIGKFDSFRYKGNDEFEWVSSESYVRFGYFQDLLRYHPEYCSANRLGVEQIIKYVLTAAGNHVIVSGLAGMGKSTVVNQIAGELAKHNSGKHQIIVSYMPFLRFVSKLKSRNPTAEQVRKAIASSVTSHPFAEQLLMKILENLEPNPTSSSSSSSSASSRFHFIFMLDAFDEIRDYEQRNTAQEALRIIRSKLANVTVLVNTRPEDTDLVEDALELLAHELCPITEEEQAEIMIHSWKQFGSVPATAVGNDVQNFARRCVKLTSHFDVLSSKTPFAAIVLAGAYSNEVGKRCNSTNKKWKYPIPKYTLEQLFDKFIEMRLVAYLARHTTMDGERQLNFSKIKMDSLVFRTEKHVMKSLHQYRAFKLFKYKLSEQAVLLENMFQWVKCFPNEQLMAYGLFPSDMRQPLTEYFFASIVVQLITEPAQSLPTLPNISPLRILYTAAEADGVEKKLPDYYKEYFKEDFKILVAHFRRQSIADLIDGLLISISLRAAAGTFKLKDGLLSSNKLAHKEMLQHIICAAVRGNNINILRIFCGIAYASQLFSSSSDEEREKREVVKGHFLPEVQIEEFSFNLLILGIQQHNLDTLRQVCSCCESWVWCKKIWKIGQKMENENRVRTALNIAILESNAEALKYLTDNFEGFRTLLSETKDSGLVLQALARFEIEKVNEENVVKCLKIMGQYNEGIVLGSEAFDLVCEHMKTSRTVLVFVKARSEVRRQNMQKLNYTRT